MNKQDFDYDQYLQAKGRAQADRYARYHRLATAPASPIIAIDGEIGRDKPVSLERVARTMDAYRDAKALDIWIDSFGGNRLEAERIYSLLRSFRGHVSARVLGTCASAATVILLAASHREAVKGARFLLHQVAADPKLAVGLRWDAKQYQLFADHLKEENRKLAQFYNACTGLPLMVFEREMSHERFLTSEGALRFGLIHKILEHTASDSLRRNRSVVKTFRWSSAEKRAMVHAGLLNRPLGIAPAVLRQMIGADTKR
jgi:ATP-dependent protease ClpP protease subunit